MVADGNGGFREPNGRERAKLMACDGDWVQEFDEGVVHKVTGNAIEGHSLFAI